MDSKASGLFQGSRCLPDKQCKCSAKGLHFSSVVCKTMPASRQGDSHWPGSGFQPCSGEQFNSPEQLSKPAWAYAA